MSAAAVTRPLRVAMLIQAYPPFIGGAERQLANLAPLLLAQGVDVHVLTRHHPGLPRFERVAGVPIYRLPAFGSKAMASAIFTASALMRLRQLKPDVLHAHQLMSPATTALAARRLWGMPVLAKPLRGGVLGDIRRLRRKSGGAWRLAAIAREVDAFAVVSREIDRELAEIGVPPARRLRLPNGIDTQWFRPADAATRAARRAGLGLPPQPLVLFSGRLAPEKGLAGLLRLWPRVRAEVADAVLLILGDGPERARLQKLATPGVVFGGVVDDMPAYLACADVFVLPSFGEGLSNALLEAMATGLPVLATAVGGTIDVIRHRQSGWLVSPKSPDELLGGLLALLRERDLAAELGARARAYVLEHHDLRGLAARLALVYRHLAQRQPLASTLVSVDTAIDDQDRGAAG